MKTEEKKMNWINVKEREPPMHEAILVVKKYSERSPQVMIDWLVQENGEIMWNKGGEVTHWIAIPLIPDALDRQKYLNKFFEFPEENNVAWYQDFTWWQTNIPGDITFRLDKFINNDRAHLRGYGYGDVIPGDKKAYGAGSICVDLKDILPYLVSDR